MSFNLNEMVQALSHLTGSMIAFKENGQNAIDFSAVTPTIIAIGDIPDSKVDELLKLTHNDPVVIWNLGSKPLTQLVKSNFRNQIVDASWRTPSQYTRAPILQTIFSLCHSIKSWYDLNDRNLTLIHCPSGHPNTGILIACLLKYIGAFEHAAHAYDFYCSKRLKGDPIHTLAPSYSSLFVNVDKIIDQNGYINEGPLFLKTITIGGLNLEDTPCLEVWDASGITYTSHVGWKADSSCSWNTESGDGFFKISQYIIGDFSIVCRFGGHLANIKDKSTLIFKYQNTTAFLTDEVVDLRHTDVDINPQYSDSIDVEFLTIHLMFETNPALIGSNADRSQKESLLPPFPRVGLEAFEAGLDEISKFHSVVPDPKKFTELVQKGLEERYVLVALQLSNNRLPEAEKLVEEMRKRARDLSGVFVSSDTTNKLQVEVDVTQTETSDVGSDDSNWEVVDFKCPICKKDSPELEDQIIACHKCAGNYHTTCVGARRIPFGTKTDKDRESRERYVKRHYGTWECGRCKRKQQQADQAEDGIANDNINGSFETSNKEPSAHSLSNPSSRASYAVSTSGGGVIVTDKLRAMTNATGQPMPKLAFTTPSKLMSEQKALSLHPPSPNIRSKHDQIALLVGLLSSSGIGIEELIKMNAQKQKETLMEVIQKKYPGYSVEASAELKGHLDLAQAMRGIIAHAKGEKDHPVTTPAATANTASVSTPTAAKAPASADRYFGGALAEEQQKQKELDREKEQVTFDPRAHMLGIIMRRGEANAVEKSPAPRVGGITLQSAGIRTGGGPGGSGDNSNTPMKVSLSSMYSGGIGFSAVGGFSSHNNGHGSGNGNGNGNRNNGGGDSNNNGPAVTLSISTGVASTKVKDIPEYTKYFKMIKAGIDRDLVAEKAVADGILGSKDVAKKLFEVNPDEPVPEDLYERLNVLVNVSNHPKYEKFFKMLKIGISKDQIKSKMEEEGVDPNMIDKDPIEKLTLTPGKSGGGSGGFANGSNSFSGNDGKVALEDHPHYSKFFKMMKVGMAKETIKVKMQQEGFDASILDKDPSERVAPPTGNEVQMVPIGEHQVYSKFFKMMKVGLPKDAVKAKMQEEGLNPDIIDKDPNELVEKEDQAAEKDEVPLNMHPKYAKYFKMLSVGLPKDSVKDKMRQEGVDPSVLDKDPHETVSRSDDNIPETGGKKKVPLSEHPLYAKYFKMLKVGLSKEAIRAKMEQEGANPDMIEKDPNEKVMVEEEKKADAAENVPVSEHPKYAKYFKMLKVGLPKDAVKAKMQQEGANPDMLDKDPTELVPLDENKKKDESPKVPVSEHPTYAKYFKMLKVGLPKDAVKAKMQQEGVNPDMLDKEPSELIPLQEKKEEEESEKVPIAEHPKYAKYFKMLKVGLAKEAVKAKMQQEGVNPDMLDKDPTELVPLDENKKKAVEMVPAGEHPKYVKYFKMLKVGLAKEAVKAKMRQEGVDPDILDKDPTEMIPLNDQPEEEEGPKVPAGEHPSYAKFFKMLKVGLPLDAVKAKVKQEGLNPDILDKDPAELIPLNDKKPDAGGAKPGLAIKPKPKRKKLHWKAFDASKVNENSLWAEEQEIDLELDEEEFKKLFVESVVDESKKKAVVAKPVKEVKKQVMLIDMKRAQNGGIALARIKFSFDELKEKLLHMTDEGMTTDQLKSMQEYLPTIDEVGALRAYKGERDALGIAERYMTVMMDFPAAGRHITIMIYKQQFKTRYIECRSKITKLQDACDDVRLSSRLKKVLKTILKVGNQLNDGEQNKGFTVDSLLKLHSAKALDKKTTILQYVVMLIFRNDEDSLKFPEDLKHVSDASRITMETIIAEKTGLQNEFEQNFKILEDIREKSPDSNTNSMLDFFVKADSHCKELEKGYEKAKEKFVGVLTYFGEDPNMPPHEFFITLSKFIQDFVSVRETIDKARKADQKKKDQQVAQDAASSLLSQHKILDKESTPQLRKAMRRHTMMPTQQKINGSNSNTPTGATAETNEFSFVDRANSNHDGSKSKDSAAINLLSPGDNGALKKEAAIAHHPASERRSTAPERVVTALTSAARAEMDKEKDKEGSGGNGSSSNVPFATPTTPVSPKNRPLVLDVSSPAPAAAVSAPLPPSSPMNASSNNAHNASTSALNFSDPNDRAALLKEALAKKALSRRKSSIM